MEIKILLPVDPKVQNFLKICPQKLFCNESNWFLVSSAEILTSVRTGSAFIQNDYTSGPKMRRQNGFLWISLFLQRSGININQKEIAYSTSG